MPCSRQTALISRKPFGNRMWLVCQSPVRAVQSAAESSSSVLNHPASTTKASQPRRLANGTRASIAAAFGSPEIGIPAVELHRDRAPGIGPMFAPVIVQTLGRDIEIAVEPPEQHSRQTQSVVPAGGQATTELPIIEAAEYGCAIAGLARPAKPSCRTRISGTNRSRSSYSAPHTAGKQSRSCRPCSPEQSGVAPSLCRICVSCAQAPARQRTSSIGS